MARVLAQRDTSAFAVLVTRHEASVRAFLRQLCRMRAHEAEDLAQETFIKAFSRLAQCRGAERLGSWLKGIAYREFLMWQRGDRRYGQALAAYGAEAESYSDPDPGVMDLDRLLAPLENTERQAIVLNHGAGLSHREVAAAMGLPVGTVKSLIQRGKQKVRRQLGASDLAPDESEDTTPTRCEGARS